MKLTSVRASSWISWNNSKVCSANSTLRKWTSIISRHSNNLSRSSNTTLMMSLITGDSISCTTQLICQRQLELSRVASRNVGTEPTSFDEVLLDMKFVRVISALRPLPRLTAPCYLALLGADDDSLLHASCSVAAYQ